MCRTRSGVKKTFGNDTLRKKRLAIYMGAISLVVLASIRWKIETDAAPLPQGGQTETRARESDRDEDYAQYGIYARTAPRPKRVEARVTSLPLELRPGDCIAFVGNTLLERDQHFGYVESMLHQRFPTHELVIRNLCWPADTPSLQPRPTNFADRDQHLTHEKADVIVAAFGFNESFAGEAGLKHFHQTLTDFVMGVTTKAFNGEAAPQVVLVSPIANENVPGVPAAKKQYRSGTIHGCHPVRGGEKWCCVRRSLPPHP